MIIGMADIPEAEITKHVQSVEGFCAYCEQLVPEEYRHVQAIVDNQKYYCCLVVRRIAGISWSKKRELIGTVMCGVRVIGYVDSVIEVSMLNDMVNRERLQAFKERGA